MAQRLDAPQELEADRATAQTGLFLPMELLVLVLQHLELSDRLSRCALVSTAWHSASLAATHSIQHRSNSKASTAVLQGWLSTHGSNIKAVQLSAAYHSSQSELQLGLWDCPHLRSISLSHMMVTQQLQNSISTPSSGSNATSSNSNSASYSTSSSSAGVSIVNDSCSTASVPQGIGFGAFKNLTSLALQYCCINSLDSLAAVTGLRQLRLEKPQPPVFSLAAAAYTLDAAALKPLQQLTSLRVIKGTYRGLFEAVAGLTGLQELQLACCKDTQAAGFDGTKPWQQLLQLTSLQVEAVPGLLLLASSSVSSSSSSSADMPGSSNGSSIGSSVSNCRPLPLQQLRRLEVVSAVGFDPLLLSAARHLRHLHLTSTPLLGGPAGTAAVLSGLVHMTNLQHLNLKGTLQHVAPAAAGFMEHAAAAAAAAAAAVGRVATAGDVAAEAAAVATDPTAALGAGNGAAAYSALTSSAGLQYLDLSRCVLPPQAVLAMFACCSRIITCSCSTSSSSGGGCSSSSSSSGGGGGSGGSSNRSSSRSRGGSVRLPLLQELLLADSFALHTPADMQALVTACPGLRKLDIIRATPYDLPLPHGMLSQLPNLRQVTCLSLCNVDDSAARRLAALTQLESLSVVWQSSISDSGVQELTALRRLTQLWVHGALSTQLAPGYLLSLQSKALPPDVWCQLQEACRTCQQATMDASAADTA